MNCLCLQAEYVDIHIVFLEKFLDTFEFVAGFIHLLLNYFRRPVF